MTLPDPFVLTARAVLFDNDGVLVDSRAAGDAAWTRWSQAHGVDPAVVLPGIHGRRSRETVARHLPAAEVDAATAHLDRLELDSAAETVAIPGAAALVAAIPDGSRALATSAGRALALARLAGAGVPAPAAIVAAADVSAGKPDPEPYLRAAALLGIPASGCIVVEDSENGILAGRAAGVAHIVGVGPTALGLGCDVVVAELTALAWTGSGLRVSAWIERARA